MSLDVDARRFSAPHCLSSSIKRGDVEVVPLNYEAPSIPPQEPLGFQGVCSEIFVGQLPHNCTGEFVRDILVALHTHVTGQAPCIIGVKEGPHRSCAFVTMDQTSAEKLVAMNKKCFVTPQAMYVATTDTGVMNINMMKHTVEAKDGYPAQQLTAPMVLEHASIGEDLTLDKRRRHENKFEMDWSGSRQFRCFVPNCAVPRADLVMCVVMPKMGAHVECFGCRECILEAGSIGVRCLHCGLFVCLECMMEINSVARREDFLMCVVPR